MEVVEQIRGKFAQLPDEIKGQIIQFDPSKIAPQKIDRKWLDKLAGLIVEKYKDKVPDVLTEYIELVNDIIDTANFLQCKDPLADVGVTFGDIAGQEEAKQALLIGYVYPLQYSNLFKTEAKGFLLYGPPGTGKTLLAKAATGVLGSVAFFNPTPGEIKGKYVGETEKNIKAIFDCAEALIRERPQDYTKAVIFFDEFDSIGGDRSGDDPNMKLSVNALLQEMEGVRVRENISVLAATNYPESLDPAILRRLTQRIPVDIPDDKARTYIILYTLVKNYTPRNPGESKKEFDARIREDTFKNGKFGGNHLFVKIKRYGIQKLLTTPGDAQPKSFKEIIRAFHLERSNKDEQTIALRRTDIDVLVELTGPNREGIELKKKILEGKIVDLEQARSDSNFSEARFGYSASDITKMTELAINNASVQSMTENYIKIDDYDFPHIICEDRDQIDTSGRGIQPVIDIRDDRIKAKVITYDIRKEHFLQALEQYKSTIKTEDYCRFLFAKRS